MFLDTADCIVVNGTTVEPGISGSTLAAGGVPVAAGAAATPLAADAGDAGAGFLVWIPAAASMSEGVILPYGPVPTTVAISTLFCFASFFAYGVMTVLEEATVAGAGAEGGEDGGEASAAGGGGGGGGGAWD